MTQKENIPAQGVLAFETVPVADTLQITTSNNTSEVSSPAAEEPFAIGEFAVYTKRGPDGEKEKFYEETNLIVNASKSFLLSGIYASGVVSDPIVSLRAGSGGALDPNGLYPKPEDPLQTNLITPVITVPTVYVISATDISVKFLADITQSQSNGTLFTEAGLITAAGHLWNIKNHPGIPKTSEFSIHYEWNVRFL